MPTAVDARCKAQVCCRSLAGIAGSIPSGVSMRSELLVAAHEKFGQLPLLTVYVVPV